MNSWRRYYVSRLLLYNIFPQSQVIILVAQGVVERQGRRVGERGQDNQPGSTSLASNIFRILNQGAGDASAAVSHLNLQLDG